MRRRARRSAQPLDDTKSFYARDYCRRSFPGIRNALDPRSKVCRSRPAIAERFDCAGVSASFFIRKYVCASSVWATFARLQRRVGHDAFGTCALFRYGDFFRFTRLGLCLQSRTEGCGAVYRHICGICCRWLLCRGGNSWQCHLTLRWSARVRNKVPGSCSSARVGQLSR